MTNRRSFLTAGTTAVFAGGSAVLLVADVELWRTVLAHCQGLIAALHHGHTAVLFLFAPLALLSFMAGRLCIELVREAARARRWQRMLATHQVIGTPQSSFVRVVVTDEPFVLTRGVRTPRTYISTGLCARLRAEELDAVLEHEAGHRARRDPLRALLWQSVATTWFFLPIVRTLAQRAFTALEIRADAYARARGATPRALFRALATITEQCAPTPRLAETGFALRARLEKRLAFLFGQHVREGVPLRAMIVSGVILGVLMAPLGTGLPTSGAAAASADRCRTNVHFQPQGPSMRIPQSEASLSRTIP